MTQVYFVLFFISYYYLCETQHKIYAGFNLLFHLLDQLMEFRFNALFNIRHNIYNFTTLKYFYFSHKDLGNVTLLLQKLADAFHITQLFVNKIRQPTHSYMIELCMSFYCQLFTSLLRFMHFKRRRLFSRPSFFQLSKPNSPLKLGPAKQQ